MKTTAALIKRNTKLFFKDKGMFFTSLITPAILLVLYAVFLGKFYSQSAGFYCIGRGYQWFGRSTAYFVDPVCILCDSGVLLKFFNGAG